MSLFQLVLRYLYTNSICFLTSPGCCKDPDVPEIRDAEELYKIAASLKIEPLRQKALRFLRASCTLSNISDRAFSTFANEYTEIDEVYTAYILRNWKTVVLREEFAKAVRPRSDAAESERIHSKYLQLVQRAAQ